MATYTRGKTSGDLAIASASGMPSITRSWISFHFAAATGVEASEYRITSARLNDTPGGQQTGKQAREIFQCLCGNALRLKL